MADPIARLNAALAGRYRVERPLGEGGMALVYLADDLRHERRVALKVLKPELAAAVGGDRFLAEIRTTAKLQHPHILPLFDSGEADGFLFYVMPYVEGESLRERLRRDRQLPVDEAVDITVKVAGALQAAHDKGVVHRDIKPANILMAGGEPMVADFGIALAVTSAGGGRLTATGVSVGTPQYMSPEQASADQDPGPASDVYSLGCVLYEMLAGEPPHAGSTAQAVLARVLTADPAPVTEHRRTTPVHVAAAVHRALERLPADRFPSANAFALAVAGLAPAGADEHPRRGRRRAARALAAAPWAIAAALGGALLWTIGRPVAPGEAARWSVVLPDSAPMVFVGEAPLGVGLRALDISRNGRTIVYVGAKGATTQLYVRPTNSPSVRALPGTEGASHPFLSPDGESVGFFMGEQLMRMSLLADEPSVVAEAADAHGGSWSDDGRLAAAIHDGAELLVVDLGSGTQQILPIIGAGPKWLPGSEWVLLTCETLLGWPCAVSPESGEVRYLSLSGPAVAPRSEECLVGWDPTFVGGDVLLYTIPDGNILMAVHFDPETLTTSGPHVEVLRGVRREGFTFQVQAAASDDGTLVFARGGDANLTELVWAGRDGEETEAGFPLGRYGAFALSPDGTRVIIQATSPAGVPELRRLDLVRKAEQKWTGGFTPHSAWTWLPGGHEFYATVVDGNKYRVLRINADAMAAGRVLYEGDEKPVIESVFPDGRIVVNWFGLHRLSLLREDELQQYGSAGGGSAPPLVEDAGGQLFFSVSPDGAWMTYSSGSSGRYEIVARRYPELDRRTLLSFDGGELPTWSPKGDGLYYRDGQRWYWVALQDSEAQPFAAPELFTTGSYLNVAGPEHAVSPDGDRLLVLRVPGGAETRELDVVVNWLSEVRGRLKASR